MVGHALSSLLKRLGFAGFLASAIAFIVKFLVSNEASPSLGKMVLPAPLGRSQGNLQAPGVGVNISIFQQIVMLPLRLLGLKPPLREPMFFI